MFLLSLSNCLRALCSRGDKLDGNRLYLFRAPTIFNLVCPITFSEALDLHMESSPSAMMLGIGIFFGIGVKISPLERTDNWCESREELDRLVTQSSLNHFTVALLDDPWDKNVGSTHQTPSQPKHRGSLAMRLIFHNCPNFLGLYCILYL